MIILLFKRAFLANSKPNLASIALIWARVGKQKPDIHVRPKS
jgi:hypothetical protein